MIPLCPIRKICIGALVFTLALDAMGCGRSAFAQSVSVPSTVDPSRIEGKIPKTPEKRQRSIESQGNDWYYIIDRLLAVDPILADRFSINYNFEGDEEIAVR